MDEEWVEYDGGAVQERHRSAHRIRVAPGVTVIPEMAFEDCEDLIAVGLSDVTTISAYAFHSCVSLERVVCSTASAVEIGTDAFANCYSMREINLGNVTEIGERAFVSCTSLRSVAIPSSVALVGAYAFEDCKSLAEVDLGEGIQCIGGGAFYSCSGLARINFPASLTDIGCEAFLGCKNLGEVELNEGLQHVGAQAFRECTSLQSINVPSSVLKVRGWTFVQCNQLRHAELQEGLQTIAEGAFYDCRSLERITIPSSTTRVGNTAFRSCASLSEVTLREGAHFIEYGAFGYDGCNSLELINIPPLAFVIDPHDVLVPPSCQLVRTATMPVTLGRKLVISKWVQYRSPGQLAQAEAKVNAILGRDDQSEEEKIRSIREWFAYFDLLDVTMMLELAIWRSNMDNGGGSAEARQAIRRNCGGDMSVIIPCVLQFLDMGR